MCRDKYKANAYVLICDKNDCIDMKIECIYHIHLRKYVKNLHPTYIHNENVT